ncbi:Ig-like domain-containing protein [Blattabacterium cuenoti]|uniref:Ig-like domain-containing protein n=1 Tax=Blattabacterium cuenoti TaxID=1653831 RepID=UPI00163C5002|nr:Ig-like domain-containing protein [Blattabacterium cuenoti]
MNFIFYFFFFFLISSCANYKPLTGGEIDISPPHFLHSIPNNYSTYVKTNLKEIKIFFNENIILNDIHHCLIINPFDMKKYFIINPINLSKKYISIQIKKNLKTNTTYSFFFKNCIKDYKEENILPFFKYVFSTGKFIDSVHIKGKISNFKKNIIIVLYKINHKKFDFSILKKKPDYIASINYKINEYQIPYIKKGKYLLFSFNDENKNKIYEQKEFILFKKILFFLENKEYDIPILK